MVLDPKTVNKIVQYVKKEPQTIQSIAKYIGRSWVTADSYVKKIQQQTGQIKIKTFRKGTQGALKLAFYNYQETVECDEVKEDLYFNIKHKRAKQEFDFMELYQFVPIKEKSCFLTNDKEQKMGNFNTVESALRKAKKQVLFFSGNASFINLKKGKKTILQELETAMERGLRIVMLCRVNIASVNNLKKLSVLVQKYPHNLDIRHRYQPLRGFIVDDQYMRFKEEERLHMYKQGELEKDTTLFYKIWNAEWIEWTQKVFWNLYKSSVDYRIRLKEIRQLQL